MTDPTSPKPVHIIGAGLAGCEAAWQIAQRGVRVVMHEMRPIRMTEAHRTENLAELVCSNSFRSDDAGANAVGLARQGVLPSARDVAGMFAEPRNAYVIYGIEPGLDFADTPAATKALASSKVVAFSYFACKSTRDVADMILPIGALPEIEATLTNLDGKNQHTQASGKLPGEAREGWKALRALGGELQLAGFEFADAAGMRDAIAHPKTVSVAKSAAPTAQGQGLELAVSAAIYRTDGTVRRAEALQAHPLNVGARIVLNPADAQAAGVADGQVAKVGNGIGTAALPVVAVSANVSAADRAAAFAAGMDDCLAKPLEREALLRWLERLSKGSSGSRTA